MLHPNPSQRPSVSEIVSSAWLRNTLWEYQKNAVKYEVLRKQQMPNKRPQHMPNNRPQQIPINRPQHIPIYPIQQKPINRPRSPEIDPSDSSSSSTDSSD